MNANQQTLFDMVQVWIIADRKGARTASLQRIEKLANDLRDVLSLQGMGIGIDETTYVVDELHAYFMEFAQ